MAIRFGDGKEVSRKGLDYVGLKLRCKYNRILAVIRHQLGREPEQGDVFIVMSKNRRLIRLFAYMTRYLASCLKRGLFRNTSP